MNGVSKMAQSLPSIFLISDSLGGVYFLKNNNKPLLLARQQARNHSFKWRTDILAACGPNTKKPACSLGHVLIR